MTSIKRFAGTALVAAALSGFGSAAVCAGEVTLKAVSGFAQGTNFSAHFERFIEKVNAEGKGVVQINYVGGGGKVMNPFELGNAVRTGVVDIGNLPGAFYTNLMPEADALKLIEMPLRDMDKPLFDYLEMLHNEKLGAHFLGRQKSKVPFHLYLNKPVEGMDLSGLKIRVTPIYRAFFASMGANLVQTAPGEVFTALERGVVDGYGWPIQGIFDLGWHEVTGYRVDPGFYSAAVEVLINLERWNELDEEQRAVLAQASRWMEETGDAEDQTLNQTERERQAKQGIETISFDGELRRKYREQAYASAWEAIIKVSPQHGPKLKELASR